jgi:hypothetical protein
MDNTIKNKVILKEDNIINDIDNINIKDKIKEDIKDMDINKNKENNKDNIDENNTIKDNDNININDNDNTYQNKSCNIDNIKSLNILQQIFNYIEDNNFPYILFKYSKSYQQKLGLTKDKYIGFWWNFFNLDLTKISRKNRNGKFRFFKNRFSII